MRGRVIFLLSLAGVTLVGIFVVRPVKVERDGLAIDILERAAGLSDPRAQGPSPRLIRLAAAIGMTRGPDRPSDVARRLAFDFAAMDRIRVGDEGVSFPMAWSDVPKLLRRLAEKPGLVVEKFEARPGNGPDRCEITLEFTPSVAGFGVR